MIEAVVGEIDDEHDVAEPRPDRRPRRTASSRSTAAPPLEDLEAALGRELPIAATSDEEIDTVAGLVTALAGRVPQRGEVIAHPDDFDFEVTDADPRRVKRLRLRPSRRSRRPPPVARLTRPAADWRSRVAREPWAARAAALAAGLAAAFAHPPFGLLPGLLGYAPAAGSVDRAAPARPLRSAFLRGWLAGLGLFRRLDLVDRPRPFLVDAPNQGWMAPFAVGLRGRRPGAVLGRGRARSTARVAPGSAARVAGLRRRAGAAANGCAATSSPAFPGICRARPGGPARRRRRRPRWSAPTA